MRRSSPQPRPCARMSSSAKWRMAIGTQVNERGSRLSQGQWQLVAFARTLLSDPKILVLDEATSSIDAKTERLVQEGLNALLKGRTSFIIAHRLSTIKNCDRILYISNKGHCGDGYPSAAVGRRRAIITICTRPSWRAEQGESSLWDNGIERKASAQPTAPERRQGSRLLFSQGEAGGPPEGCLLEMPLKHEKKRDCFWAWVLRWGKSRGKVQWKFGLMVFLAVAGGEHSRQPSCLHLTQPT